MKRLWILGAALLVMAGAVVVAEGRQMHGGGMHGMHMRHGGPGMHGDMDRHLDHLADELDLTAEQQEAAKKLHRGVRDEAEAIFDQQRDIHETIEDLLDSANPDPTALGQKMIEGHALHKRLEGMHDNLFNQFKALLTPEQQKKLETLKAERHRFHSNDGPCSPPED